MQKKIKILIYKYCTIIYLLKCATSTTLSERLDPPLDREVEEGAYGDDDDGALIGSGVSSVCPCVLLVRTSEFSTFSPINIPTIITFKCRLLNTQYTYHTMHKRCYIISYHVISYDMI